MAARKPKNIRAALDNGVGYIGLVASKVRGAAVLDALGLSATERARIRTPVGLAIGAKTPAEIAVAIAAEIIAAVRAGGGGRPAPVDATAAEAVDPVCGMTVLIGPATEHLRLAGADYWFCCPACRTAFSDRNGGA